MNYTITQSTAFPMVDITLAMGQEIQIENGCMVYHDGNIALEGKTNSNSSGVGGFLKAVGRSMVSGESVFITTAKAMTEGAKIAIAPTMPGSIRELKLGDQQWRLNDSAFLACDAGVTYELKRQTVGKALFAGTGGFFVMETTGVGSMLINSYGDIIEIQLDGTQPLVVDNSHVAAWSATLNYEIKVASGTFGFKTGEGLVNEFKGVGTVMVQTRNVKSLADVLIPFLPDKG